MYLGKLEGASVVDGVGTCPEMARKLSFGAQLLVGRRFCGSSIQGLCESAMRARAWGRKGRQGDRKLRSSLICPNTYELCGGFVRPDDAREIKVGQVRHVEEQYLDLVRLETHS